MCFCMSAMALEAREDVRPLELELQVFVSDPSWVLRPELQSSKRAGCTLKHRATSPAPGHCPRMTCPHGSNVQWSILIAGVRNLE